MIFGLGPLTLAASPKLYFAGCMQTISKEARRLFNAACSVAKQELRHLIGDDNAMKIVLKFQDQKLFLFFAF